jgi:quercetin dioxygenase-like cupin family protein
MNRRDLLATVTTLAGAALVSSAAAKAAAQSSRPITHVNTKTDGPPLPSSVVKAESLSPEGAAPGAKARVYFNGPTAQLAALAAGLVTLEPGAEPHPPHRHPEEEIMIVGEGAGEFSINGIATPVQAGDALFAESNVLHGVRNTGQTRMTFYFIKLKPKAA